MHQGKAGLLALGFPPAVSRRLKIGEPKHMRDKRPERLIIEFADYIVMRHPRTW
jgi:hypothetical protein